MLVIAIVALTDGLLELVRRSSRGLAHPQSS
jgi:hypothetical protein